MDASMDTDDTTGQSVQCSSFFNKLIRLWLRQTPLDLSLYLFASYPWHQQLMKDHIQIKVQCCQAITFPV